MDYVGYEQESVDDVCQYGTKRHSGRYPWGSGDNPYQHSGEWLGRVKELKAQGMSEKDIAMAMGLESTTELRVYYRRAEHMEREDKRQSALSLKADGLSNVEIGRRLGMNESSVRSLLDERSANNANKAENTAKVLMDTITTKDGKFIDVGEGVERELGVSRETLEEALYICAAEGYPVYTRNVAQMTNPGKYTKVTVVCPPGTEYKEVYDESKIDSFKEYSSNDGGETFYKFQYPSSLDSSRLMVRYAEEGGLERDGTMEIRRGVEDLSLGDDHYAQVRILVDNSHYLKGMAVYSDNMPDGVDIIFNTNKTKEQAPEKLDALKKIKDDPDNPFGSAIKAGGQRYYDDPDGKFINPDTGNPASLSLINKRAAEGDWSDWSNAVPSQFLSKQSQALAQKQIDLAIDIREQEYKDIMELNNPTVRKQLLQDFADGCDSNAVNLKAAALPRQKYHVILPDPNLKEDETYAPNYEDGTKLALIRYPHGGTFEIPIVTVNNKASEWSKQMIGTSEDALSINSKVAERLSGADFDGDTVMAIPVTSSVQINSREQLKDLVGFDSKSYKFSKEALESGSAKLMKDGSQKQKEMGIASNLITDMTLKGATDEELARAVKYSMVVIDAPKHKLDYSTAKQELGIDALKAKYQGHIEEDGSYHEGASTLISKAKSEQRVEKRVGSPHINTQYNARGQENPWYDPSKPEGSIVYNTKKETYIDKHGKEVERQTSSTKMAEATDAFSLVSDMNTPMERIYANYANKLKTMANEARKQIVVTKDIEYNKEAAAVYKEEVASLNAQLNLAKENKPKERQAQVVANGVIKAKQQSNPNMTKEDLKKAKNQALQTARANLGARKERVKITEKEWEAIQAGAISPTKLKDILKNCDMDTIRTYALPKSRQNGQLSASKIALIKSMAQRGHTQAEIAAQLGVSVSTVNNYT